VIESQSRAPFDSSRAGETTTESAVSLEPPAQVLILTSAGELDAVRVARAISAVAGDAGARAVWSIEPQMGTGDRVTIVLHDRERSFIETTDLIDALEAAYRDVAEPSDDRADALEPLFADQLVTGAHEADVGASGTSATSELPRSAFPGERTNAVPSPTRAIFGHELSAATSASVARFAAAEQCAPSMVLFAAFAALQQRYSSDASVDIAAIAASSDGAAGRAMPAQIDFSGARDFRSVVHRARRPSRSAGMPAIAFDLRQRRITEPVFIESTVRLARTSPDAFAPAITVDAVRTGERIALRWRFDPQRYERTTIERIAAHFASLLPAALSDPDRPIVAVPLTGDEERADRIAAGQGSRRPYERTQSIVDRWAAQVAATPDAVAIADEHTSITYARADRRANRLANYLIAAGVTPGSGVGIAFDRSVDVPLTLLAILKAGAAYVPLDQSYPRERLDAMIADAGCTVIVSQGDLAGQTPFAARVVRLDRDDAAIEAVSDASPNVRVCADDLAYITYTSGSTGRPKGVLVRHRGVVRLVRNVDYVDIGAHDGFLLHAPLAFDASTFEIWAPLLNGARLGVPRPGLLSIAELAAAIGRFNVSVMFLTTALFGRLVESGLPAFGRIEQVLTGGEVASPSHMVRFIALYPRCRLIAVYGPTENTTFSTWHPLPTVEAVGSNVPIGRPIANATAYVVDANGEPAAVGVTGELWVGGDGVAAGYANRPDLTDERFAADPFDDSENAVIYKTGDRARWRDDDVLEFLGRTDDQVKIRGFRIELGEIESVLQAHPDVQDAAVVVAAEAGEKVLSAFVVPRIGRMLTEPMLRDLLLAKLPRYMLPQRLTVITALPEHASGKVDRAALAQAASPSIRATASRARTDDDGGPRKLSASRALPISPDRRMQRTVAQIWQTELQLDAPPDIDANFFDAGGDSLKLLAVHAHVCAELQTGISIMALFEHSTIRKLAAYLASSKIEA
jgi:amino acid adenylation domain-containing protein